MLLLLFTIYPLQLIIYYSLSTLTVTVDYFLFPSCSVTIYSLTIYYLLCIISCSLSTIAATITFTISITLTITLTIAIAIIITTTTRI